MTTATIAEAALGTRSQLDQWRHRRRLRDSTDEDEAPAVEKRATSPLRTRSEAPLTRLEERIEAHKNKLAVRAFMKRERAKLADLKEQLAHQQQAPSKTAADFARRLKYGR